MASQTSKRAGKKIVYTTEVDLSDMPAPEPCVTAQMEVDANPGFSGFLPGPVDIAKFPTNLDVLIVKCLASGQIAVKDSNPVVIYNTLNGYIYSQFPVKSDSKYDYKKYYITVTLAQKLIVHLPVHRISYYASLKPDERYLLLGRKFDVHHIDGDTSHNTSDNLEPVPRAFHSHLGAAKNLYEAMAANAEALSNALKTTKEDAVSLVKALRVCAEQFPACSNRKAPVYRYFSDKMHLSRRQIRKIAVRHSAVLIPDATPEETDEILQRYAWIFEQMKANNYRSVTELVEPDDFIKTGGKDGERKEPQQPDAKTQTKTGTELQ